MVCHCQLHCQMPDARCHATSLQEEHASFNIGLHLPSRIQVAALVLARLYSRMQDSEGKLAPAWEDLSNRRRLAVCATNPDRVRLLTACRYHAPNGRRAAETVVSVSRCQPPRACLPLLNHGIAAVGNRRAHLRSLPLCTECPDRAAAELIDALPSYCEATRRIYQTYALLRAQGKVCCPWSSLPAAFQHLSDFVEGSSPAGQMDPEQSLIQLVLIRSLHKGQADDQGGDWCTCSFAEASLRTL